MSYGVNQWWDRGDIGWHGIHIIIWVEIVIYQDSQQKFKKTKHISFPATLVFQYLYSYIKFNMRQVQPETLPKNSNFSFCLQNIKLKNNTT